MRYCSCRRSSNASRSNETSPLAIAAPSIAAEAALCAASAWVTFSGRPFREAAVLVRAAGTARIAATGMSAAIREAWIVPRRFIAMQTPP